MWYENLLAKNLIPDFLIRAGIRAQLSNKLGKEYAGGPEAQEERFSRLVSRLKESPIALFTKEANEQHYELPAEFFKTVLGKHLKYSSGYWPERCRDLDASEKNMLELYCSRARLSDGQTVLDLGCGWGSLSLYMAAKYPRSRITGVSNSSAQKAFIEEEAAERGLANLEIITADINDYRSDRLFDRVLSVEMFEHLRNYEKLFEKVSSWMKPDALLFVHIFTHRELAYLFDETDRGSWMAKYFFTGGIMPSHHLFLSFPKHLAVHSKWKVDGTHYQKTCEAWLSKIDAHTDSIMPLFKKTYGEQDALRWRVYWRVFFMACAELFGYRGGEEWMVSHYLFQKQPRETLSPAQKEGRRPEAALQ